AQFGRGVMADVSSKLLGQFVECLHNNVLAGDAAGSSDTGSSASESSTGEAPGSGSSASGAPATATPSTGAAGASPAAGTPQASAQGGVRKIDAPEARAVDLGRVAGGAVAKRLVPIVVVAAV